jgi:CRISPR-associated protein Cmr1
MQVRLALRTVTPLFWGGALQQAELRPASVRGALRFWLRAGLGGVIGTNDLGRLAGLEDEVFGRTGAGSSMVLRVVPRARFVSSSAPLLPHKGGAQAGFASAIPVDTPFDLTLALTRRAPISRLEIALWSTLLWLTLGGNGRRARRGFGALLIESVSDLPDSLPAELRTCLTSASTCAADGPALARRVGDLIGKAQSALASFAREARAGSSEKVPSFSTLQADTRVVVWVPAAQGPNAVLAELMTRLSSRMAKDPAAFRDGFGGIQPVRRASPLLAACHRLQQGHALVLTHLRAALRVNPDGTPHPGKPEEVDAFLDALGPDKWEAHPLPRSGESGHE